MAETTYLTTITFALGENVDLLIDGERACDDGNVAEARSCIRLVQASLQKVLEKMTAMEERLVEIRDASRDLLAVTA